MDGVLRIIGHLFTALCGTAEFRSGDHARLIGKERGGVIYDGHMRRR